MNSALVLIALLLAVPLQLFLTHYINSKYETTPTDDPLLADKNNIQSARVEAFHRQVCIGWRYNIVVKEL